MDAKLEEFYYSSTLKEKCNNLKLILDAKLEEFYYLIYILDIDRNIKQYILQKKTSSL